MEILTPTVKHGEESNGCTEVLGVRRDRQQRLRHCAEEDAVDCPGILHRQAGDLLR